MAAAGGYAVARSDRAGDPVARSVSTGDDDSASTWGKGDDHSDLQLLPRGADHFSSEPRLSGTRGTAQLTAPKVVRGGWPTPEELRTTRAADTLLMSVPTRQGHR